jgi:hypothetical protein
MNQKPGLQQTDPPPPEEHVPTEKQMDEALQMTFPASDPTAYQDAMTGSRAKAPEVTNRSGDAAAGDLKDQAKHGEPVADDNSGAPDRNDLTKSEKPGGELEMPRSDRATDLRDDANDQRDSNDLGSGTST